MSGRKRGGWRGRGGRGRECGEGGLKRGRIISCEDFGIGDGVGEVCGL